MRAGDDVQVRGEYIYDPRGGIIHYTHHDPRGRHLERLRARQRSRCITDGADASLIDVRELRAVFWPAFHRDGASCLASLGLRVLVMPTGCRRTRFAGLDAARPRAHFMPRAKAGKHGLQRMGSNVMVAADTVVDRRRHVARKPAGRPKPPAMLRVLSGREHLVHTAFVVVDGTSGRRLERHLDDDASASPHLTKTRSKHMSRPANRSTRPAPTASKGAARRWSSRSMAIFTRSWGSHSACSFARFRDAWADACRAMRRPLRLRTREGLVA